MTIPNRYTAGDDIIIAGTINHNGVVQDISGWTLKCAITKTNMKDLATGTSIEDGVIVDGLAGRFSVEFPSTDTKDIVAGDYWLEVEATVSGKVRTMDRVKIQIFAGSVVPPPVVP